MLYFSGTFHLFTRKITRATNAVINIQVQIFYLHGTYIVNTWIDSSIFNKNRDTTFVKTSLNSRSSLYVCCSLSLLVFISSSSCSCSPNLAQRTNKNKCLFSTKRTIYCRLDRLLWEKRIIFSVLGKIINAPLAPPDQYQVQVQVELKI